MKNQDVRIGMRVTPRQKSVKEWSGIRNSIEWKCRIGNFLFVKGWEEELECWILSSSSEEGVGGDFFNSKDFKPYAEESTDES